ncbi:MAG: hypothetical protein VXY90_03650 [Pseudomonadota bacterium]|nr:hypothetical protein [Pseudomonadota bacterium]
MGLLRETLGGAAAKLQAAERGRSARTQLAQRPQPRAARAQPGSAAAAADQATSAAAIGGGVGGSVGAAVGDSGKIR